MTEHDHHQECIIERRQHGDRLMRAEVVIERMEADIAGLHGTYKEMSVQQQTMFVEAIKSSVSLQTAIEHLNGTVAEFMLRFSTVEKKVDEHERWKWKTTGVITGVVLVVNIVGWVIAKLAA